MGVVKYSAFSFLFATPDGLFGLGLALTAPLLAVQAPSPEQDVAVATTCWAFVSSFGSISKSRAGSLLYTVGNEEVRELLRHGGAYEQATVSLIRSFDTDLVVKQQLVDMYCRHQRIVAGSHRNYACCCATGVLHQGGSFATGTGDRASTGGRW
jgi:hypothetical protein